ncbi:hypothetical protein [uncultured Ornithinimicrobium sp.]|uniref:hypothetical protein n=1 Tax=uncultured Ornithinimicrobium sp. TaxID=259307 RepID=UPI0025946031|nr:hypothetical protein [uncultured Ornithinimicrobium sp.]
MSPGAPVPASGAEELREVADGLRAASSELRRLPDEVRGPGAGPSWVGLAALEQAARAEATARLLAALADPLEHIAGVLRGVADATDDARQETARWQHRADQAVEELARLRAAVPTAEPAVQGLVASRIEQLELEVVRAAERVRRTEEELETVRLVASRALREAVSPLRALLEQVVTLGLAGHKLVKAHRPVRRAVVAAAGLTTVARASWARDAAARAAARARLRDAPRRWAQLRQQPSPGRLVPPPLRGPVALLGRLSPAWTWFGALSDLVDGGGRTGWRAGATRAVAAGAVLGVPALALATVLPPVGLAGMVAVGAYTAWTTGSWLYDHREAIGRAAGATWSRARSGGARAGRWVQRAGGDAVRRARDRARRGLQRLAQTRRLVGAGATRVATVTGRWALELRRTVGAGLPDPPAGRGGAVPAPSPGGSW